MVNQKTLDALAEAEALTAAHPHLAGCRELRLVAPVADEEDCITLGTLRLLVAAVRNGLPGVSPLQVGDMLYGFCRGAFGRDSFDDKTVEAIGPDWVVCRTKDGHVAVYEGDPQDLTDYRTPEED
jgi:hypothetical protein